MTNPTKFDAIYTHSSSASFRACRRQYKIAYVDGIRAKRPAMALRLGTFVHLWLELYWRARQAGATDPAEAAWRGVAASASKHPDAEYVAFDSFDEYEQARLRVMLLAYAAVWGRVECTVIAVEAKFTVPLIHPETREVSRRFQRAGKIDVILRLADGRIAVVEHKTSAADVSPGGDYRRKLTLDPQVSMYYAGALSLGFRPDVVIYDILKKFDERPLKATPPDKLRYVTDRKTKEKRLNAKQRLHEETPAEYAARLVKIAAKNPEACIERVELHRLPEERKRYALAVWQQAQDMAHAADNDLYYTNPDSCLRYGAPCDYLPHCSEGASLADPYSYRHVGAHPELQDHDAAKAFGAK